MKFESVGNWGNPVIILIHGGGLSNWVVEPIAQILKKDFYIVMPIIDGHGEDYQTEFISIRDSSKKIIKYIDETHNGSVFAICGLSIGSQIIIDTISLRNDIALFTMIESALILPIKSYKYLIKPMINLTYSLIKKKWFSRIQAKSLLIPETFFEKYYEDSCKMSKRSLNNILKSNSSFEPEKSLQNSKAKSLIIYGQKEIKLIKKSAKKLNEIIPESKIIEIPKCKHGELSQLNINYYVDILYKFINNEIIDI